MSLTSQIESMDTAEKLRTMEALWQNLSQKTEDLPIPAWHATELEATEKKVEAGLESPIEWQKAKDLLRQRFA